MALSLADKLRIKPDMKIFNINAPQEFQDFLVSIGRPPKGPWVVKGNPKEYEYDQIHWFVKTQKELHAGLENKLAYLKDDILCWIFYPKGSSGIQTDLTRDTGWEALEHHEQIQFVSLISFDDTWSAFAIRLKTEKSKKKTAPSRADALAEFVDSKAKTVSPPKDLAAALAKSKQAKTFFETLSFTNRKEYVEWVVSAKKAETREARIQGAVEKLKNKWKNPRNL